MTENQAAAGPDAVYIPGFCFFGRSGDKAVYGIYQTVIAGSDPDHDWNIPVYTSFENVRKISDFCIWAAGQRMPNPPALPFRVPCEDGYTLVFGQGTGMATIELEGRGGGQNSVHFPMNRELTRLMLLSTAMSGYSAIGPRAPLELLQAEAR